MGQVETTNAVVIIRIGPTNHHLPKEFIALTIKNVDILRILLKDQNRRSPKRKTSIAAQINMKVLRK